MKSAFLKTEALKRSKAEIVEESHSLRQLSSIDQRLSNSELGCSRMFELSRLQVRASLRVSHVEDTLS
jgi:hypothetical protein